MTAKMKSKTTRKSAAKYGVWCETALGADKWCTDILSPENKYGPNFQGTQKEASRLCKAFQLWQSRETYVVKRYPT